MFITHAQISSSNIKPTILIPKSLKPYHSICIPTWGSQSPNDNLIFLLLQNGQHMLLTDAHFCIVCFFSPAVTGVQPEIVDIILSNISRSQYRFYLLQAKRHLIFSTKTIVYKLPPVLLNDLRLRILENCEIFGRS